MLKYLKRNREREREKERERERERERDKERERNSYIYIHFIQMKQSQNCKTLVIYLKANNQCKTHKKSNVQTNNPFLHCDFSKVSRFKNNKQPDTLNDQKAVNLLRSIFSSK